jgi:hypothetical protein
MAVFTQNFVIQRKVTPSSGFVMDVMAVQRVFK